LGKSKFHVFVGSQTGRSYLFDTIEAKSLLASEGMPELTVRTQDNTRVMVHVARSLDIARANEWFKEVFKTIQKDTNRFHLVVVDDLRVSADVLGKLLSSLNRLENNCSMLISWNQTEALDAKQVTLLQEKAQFYRLHAHPAGSSIHTIDLQNSVEIKGDETDLFDF
jgi:hypothetical protein